jgi:hypothetical protein
MQKQLPEAENGNEKKNVWKLVVLVVCLPVIAFLGGNFFENVKSSSAIGGVVAKQEAQERGMMEIKAAQSHGLAIVHKRIDVLDQEKVDEKVLTQCLKTIDEKITNIGKNIDKIERRLR